MALGAIAHGCRALHVIPLFARRSATHFRVHTCAGWHPLTATLVDSFQPNSTNISTSEGRVAVVTGPNASGKSVYLEQVGIIVYLAHIGCFVPAQHAEIGLTDRIITRMVCDEGHDALFAKDLVQLSNILTSASPRSLVLIDEFGKVWCCSPVDDLGDWS